MKTKTMTCSGCGGVLPTHNAWCDVLRPRLDPAPAEPSVPCRVCEAAHALCLSGAPASAADFLRAAVVQERKAKEKAEAERDEALAKVRDWRKAAEDNGNRVAELVHAHYAERERSDRWRSACPETVNASDGWATPSWMIAVNALKLEALAHDARRAAEANPSAQIGDVVALAMAAERERCARIVEAFENTDPDRAIAAAAERIRSGK